MDLLSTYAGQGPDLGPWLKDAVLNRDRNLRLQYLAGMGLESQQGIRIYNDIKAYCRFPESIFVASGPRGESLKRAIEGTVQGQ